MSFNHLTSVDTVVSRSNKTNTDYDTSVTHTHKTSRYDVFFLNKYFKRSRIYIITWIIKSPKQRLKTYCFCFVSYYNSYSFFPRSMNLSMADHRNYRTEFHETWWSYRYMFLVDPKVFRFVVKGVKAIFLGVQREWGLL